ncbi:MAG: hypothetical protein H6737_23345 [Alphaproteobacteria bacterium]|nr:hypothetical protein [Alphaproteobacteria bacterium]
MLLALLLSCRPTPPADCPDAPWVDGTVEVTSALEWDDATGIYVGETSTFALPDDVVSFAATVDLPGVQTAFARVRFAGRTWIDASLAEGDGAWWSEPYFHWAGSGATVVAPIDADSAPSGGCLELQPAALDPGEARLVLTVRTGGTQTPTIDVNVVLVGDTELFQEDLDEAVAVATRAWTSGGGPSIGEVATYRIEGDAILDYRDSTALRATVVDPDREDALNLFFVTDYADASGTLGEAGGIPGPIGVQGVDEAGVIIALDPHRRANGTIDTQLLGEVVAHEAGHQLGLFHTTESDGSRTEPLAGTPACPADADRNGDGYWVASECVDYDGTNFMFWVAASFDQDVVAPEQGFVLARSPIARGRR